MRASAVPPPLGAGSTTPPSRRLRLLLGRLQLVSGMVLTLYVTTHLINHTLGLWSLDAMESGRALFSRFWHLGPSYVLMLGSLVVHPALALHRLWRRRSLRMSLREVVQLVLGLLIPGFLALHLLGSTAMSLCCELRATYAYELRMLWPGGMVRQTLLMGIVWLHACIGIHAWAELKPFFARWRPWLVTFAAMLPVLAFLGTVNGGRELLRLQQGDATAGGRLIPWDELPGADVRWFWIELLEQWIIWGFAGIVVAVLAARLIRAVLASRRSLTIRYDGDRVVKVPPGLTLLEASRVSDIPHASVCGGRGRCSTCRVRIVQGERLPLPDAAERQVLERISAEPDVRLACRLRPVADISIARLMPAHARLGSALRPMIPAAGREREITVLFSDLRGFTSLAEQRLPYDTVYLLNRYFAAMGAVIEEAGGRLDKFIGDGIMALFGLESGGPEGARQALRAVQAMSVRLDALNAELAGELPQRLRMGLGLHLGRAIVGEMGWGRATGLTAIGDPVNVASRLEALTKEHGVELLVSADLLRRAGIEDGVLPLIEVPVRGRGGRLLVAALPSARTLADLPGFQPLRPPQSALSRSDSVRAMVRSWSRLG